MTTYYAAVTRRPSDIPMRHALAGDFEKLPGQTTVSAACGARVARAVGYWDAEHERACPRCREVAA